MNTADAKAHASRFVHDMSDNLHLWLIDASNRQAIECHTVCLEPGARTEYVEQQLASAMDNGAPVNELIARAGLRPTCIEEGAFSNAGDIVNFLAGQIDPTLRRHAQTLMQEMGLV
jgi:hypothetical protein